MPRRTRYILTVRFGLGIEKQTLRAAAEPIALHLSRIQQLQIYALDALLHAASDGRKVTRPGLRSDIIEALRMMAPRD
jgi:DNA-directed RNA polymerase sigma subunit (sigma70/sigma32)